MPKQAKITSYLNSGNNPNAFGVYIKRQEKLIDLAKYKKLSKKEENLSLTTKSNATDRVTGVINRKVSAIHYWIDNELEAIYSVESEKKQFEILDEYINSLLEFEQKILHFSLSHEAMWFEYTIINYHKLSLLYFLRGDRSNCLERFAELYEMCAVVYNNLDLEIHFIEITRSIIFTLQKETNNFNEITKDSFNLKFSIAVDIVKRSYDVLNNAAFFKGMFIRFLKILESGSKYKSSCYEVLWKLLDEYKDHCFYEELTKKWLVNETFSYKLQCQQEKEFIYDKKCKRDKSSDINSLNKQVSSHEKLSQRETVKKTSEQCEDQSSGLVNSNLTSRLSFD